MTKLPQLPLEPLPPDFPVYTLMRLQIPRRPRIFTELIRALPPLDIRHVPSHRVATRTHPPMHPLFCTEVQMVGTLRKTDLVMEVVLHPRLNLWNPLVWAAGDLYLHSLDLRFNPWLLLLLHPDLGLLHLRTLLGMCLQVPDKLNMLGTVVSLPQDTVGAKVSRVLA